MAPKVIGVVASAVGGVEQLRDGLVEPRVETSGRQLPWDEIIGLVEDACG